MRRVRSRDAETGLYTVEEVDTQRVITLVPLEYFFSGNPEQVDGFVHCGSSATQKELRQAERISRRCFLPPRLHAAAGQNFPLSPIPSTIFSHTPPHLPQFNRAWQRKAPLRHLRHLANGSARRPMTASRTPASSLCLLVPIPPPLRIP